MADYPTSIPSLTRVGNGIVGGADDPAADGSSTDAVVVITDLQDELEAVATELGTTPSGASATVAARFTAVEADVAGKEDTGVAATLVDAHAGATDPHQDRQYTDDSISSLDATLVHLTGDESVDGVKTFLDPPVSITPATLANELVSKAVMDAAISAAVNALVDGAPGALDTLNELAAALGDDAAFQSTVTTALAGKLASSSNLSDLANIATARTNLGLGTAAVRDVGTTTGTVAAGDDSRLSDTRTPTDDTVSTAKLVARAVTFAKLQAIATARLLGRSTAGSGDVEELTAAQATAMLDVMAPSTKGLVPAPSASPVATKYLAETGIWATPSTGSAFTKGTAAPSGGSDGDWYERTTYGQLYQKVSGTWTLVERNSAGSLALAAAAGSNFASAGGWSANELGGYTFGGDATQTGTLFNTKVGSPTITARTVAVASATLSGAYATAAISGTRELCAVFSLTTLASSGRTLYVGLGLGFGSYPWPYVGITNAGAMTLYSGGGTNIKTLSGTMGATGRVVMKMVTGAVLVACLNSSGVVLDQALFASPYVTAGYLTSLGGAKILVGGDGTVYIEALEVTP